MFLTLSSSPSLFGIPLVVSCSPSTSCQALYKMVWQQVCSPNSSSVKHAIPRSPV